VALNRRRIKRLLRSIVIFSVIIGIIYGLGWSKLIQVKNISYSGTSDSQVISDALLREQVSLKIGMPLARVDVRAISRIALQQGWVLGSKVSRNWLSGKISIAIIERKPIAVFTTTNNLISYFDADGTIFNSPVQYGVDMGSKPLPNISFTRNTPLARKMAAEWVAAMPSEFLATMTSLVVSTPTGIVMKAVDAGNGNKAITVIWGEVRDMPLKVSVLRALVLRPENKTHHIFDLTSPLAPITR
jgi:cell division septal protein FtsQ